MTRGAAVDIIGSHGWTILHICMSTESDSGGVRRTRANSLAALNSQWRGKTPLHVLAAQGAKEPSQRTSLHKLHHLLAIDEVDISRRSENGETAARVCCPSRQVGQTEDVDSSVYTHSPFRNLTTLSVRSVHGMASLERAGPRCSGGVNFSKLSSSVLSCGHLIPPPPPQHKVVPVLHTMTSLSVTWSVLGNPRLNDEETVNLDFGGRPTTTSDYVIDRIEAALAPRRVFSMFIRRDNEADSFLEGGWEIDTEKMMSNGYVHVFVEPDRQYEHTLTRLRHVPVSPETVHTIKLLMENGYLIAAGPATGHDYDWWG